MKDIKDKLEFEKILEKIAGIASTENGKSEIHNLTPLINKEEVIKEGEIVSEAKTILIESDYPPFEYLPDLTDSLYKAKIEGSILDIKEIKYILVLMQLSRKIFNYLNSRIKNETQLTKVIQNLFIDKVLEHHIEKIFDEKGDISDNASENLKTIRKKIIEKKDNLRKIVNRILKTYSEKYLVQEEYITMRDGRIVLPVKVEYKRQVKGFIHSESSTGQTVYIEPEETLDMNNEILSLTFAEKREIDKILYTITRKIGENTLLLVQALNTISKIDSIFARAKYSIEIIGAFPSFDSSSSFQIINGKHPSLVKKLGNEKTVPLNIEIKNDRVIIITGPNAGGKTVALKTFGLLVLLAHSGIHIPVHPDSNFHFIDKVLADIGDDQSIEDDLSTFSSHLKNIKSIIDNANENTLVLLDEIGTGTDPAEGSALATSILLSLMKKKAIVLASTHHGNLKIVADNIEGFQNASMEFDNEKLMPTYKFRQGIPGSSYAFEVAKRIGFDEEFINTAKEYLDTKKSKVEELIISLETKSHTLEQKLKTYEIENTRLSGLTNLYEGQLKKLNQQKNEIIKQAKDQAERYLNNINKEFESTIKRIRETNADKEVIKQEKQKIEKLKEETIKFSKEKIKTENIEETVKIACGDYVRIKDTSTEGIVSELIEEKNNAVILAGSIKLKVKLSNLIKIKKPLSENTSSSIYSNIFTGNVNLSLDIRGKKPEEVEFEIVRFVDEGVLANSSRLEIIHGKGTGVLKNTVWNLLKKHESVKNYYFANVEFGGDGVTIIELK